MAAPPSERDLHIQLEKDVSDYLHAKDYVTAPNAYHDIFPKAIIQRLSQSYCPTSLAIRGRADRLAVHTTHSFEYEIKTHETATPGQQDLLIEALPLCHHLAAAQLGVRCLYCYRNPHEDGDYETDYGFWVSNLPQIEVIMIPPRWRPTEIRWLRMMFQKWLPRCQIVEMRTGTLGTDDAFAKINRATVIRLPHWQRLIDAEFNRYTQTRTPVFTEADCTPAPVFEQADLPF
jgi:hypothetical protein